MASSKTVTMDVNTRGNGLLTDSGPRLGIQPSHHSLVKGQDGQDYADI